ncbi:hypothetical protein ACTI_62210 [Actinoplanes sp. OR16]|uniref:hypothetical protein n=1 Tax=Actinoplanes sp. OR16 TaxID=946334 RepID=UPI000F6BC354|nr:hypothetical protein [Actinoplanes sp. OR16]BBH69536.1 hypothetical protein ACTI_62210 [Actinoplanes sp. OR16]
MIKVRGAAAALILAGALPAACADQSAQAGCDPATAGIRWAEPVTGSRLIEVTLHRERARMPPEGEEVLSDPFGPSITGLEAPASWIPVLAGSLGAEIRRTVGTGTAELTGSRSVFLAGGLDDPTNTDSLFWTGVTTVSAGFTVGCATPASGTFTSWTETTAGAVTCGSRSEPDEELGRQARGHCPRTPSEGPAPYLRLPDGYIGSPAPE